MASKVEKTAKVTKILAKLAEPAKAHGFSASKLCLEPAKDYGFSSRRPISPFLEIFVFDWENVLFPSSWVKHNSTEKELARYLLPIDCILLELISFLKERGEIYILSHTPETEVWRLISFAYPRVFSQRAHLRVIGSSQIGKVHRWRTTQFHHLHLSNFLTDSGTDEKTCSTYRFWSDMKDREGIVSVSKYELPVYLKSFKFTEKLDPAGLYHELYLIFVSFRDACLIHPMDMDYIIGLEKDRKETAKIEGDIVNSSPGTTLRRLATK